jgi:modulator of FtsH protease
VSSPDYAVDAPLDRDRSHALFGQTMGLVAVTAGLFALGAYLGGDMSYRAGWVWYFAALAALIGLNFAAARSQQLAIGLLFGFGVLIGLGTAPVIAYYAATNPQSVWQAGGATREDGSYASNSHYSVCRRVASLIGERFGSVGLVLGDSVMSTSDRFVFAGVADQA